MLLQFSQDQNCFVLQEPLTWVRTICLFSNILGKFVKSNIMWHWMCSYFTNSYMNINDGLPLINWFLYYTYIFIKYMIHHLQNVCGIFRKLVFGFCIDLLLLLLFTFSHWKTLDFTLVYFQNFCDFNQHFRNNFLRCQWIK